MFEFLNKIAADKKEYKQMLTRIEALPNDFQFVYERIQKYMWKFAAGDGYDMIKIHYDLIDLFEAGAADGKHILDITGQDVAAFCDELLRNAKTYTDKWRKDLNRDIKKRFDFR